MRPPKRVYYHIVSGVLVPAPSLAAILRGLTSLEWRMPSEAFSRPGSSRSSLCVRASSVACTPDARNGARHGCAGCYVRAPFLPMFCVRSGARPVTLTHLPPPRPFPSRPRDPSSIGQTLFARPSMHKPFCILLPTALDFRCRLRKAPLACSSLHSTYAAPLPKKGHLLSLEDVAPHVCRSQI